MASQQQHSKKKRLSGFERKKIDDMKKSARGNATILSFVSKKVVNVSDADTSVAEEIIEGLDRDHRVSDIHEFHVQKDHDIDSTLDRTGAGADEQQGISRSSR